MPAPRVSLISVPVTSVHNNLPWRPNTILSSRFVFKDLCANFSVFL